MKQLDHIQKNYDKLILKSKITKVIREFFETENFVEIDPPILIKYPDSEPHLSPIEVKIENENKEKFFGFLHTSPEYTMKKALAIGFKNIFAITHCFRGQESFGGSHNPEFTMLEWYRANENFEKIMDDTENLLKFIGQKTEINSIGTIKIDRNWERISVKDLWQKYVGVDLDDYLEKEKMFELCQKLGFNPLLDEPYEDLFYRIFLNKIEPFLGKEIPTIVYNYPAQMAALARLTANNKYAERFEVYINGIELANAFSELTDEKEQRKRMEKDNKTRIKDNKPTFNIDGDFVEAVGKMPECAGIALGIDRLTMLFANCQNIDDILVLPASKIWGDLKN